MKKLLTFLTLLMLFFATAGAAETVYKTLTFTSTTMQTNVQNYTSTWNTICDGFTWTLQNFNNNNRGWQYVKCGNKSVANVGTITTNAFIDEAVTKVVVTVTGLNSNYINSTKLYVASDADFTTDVQEITVTAATGEMTYSVPTPAENMYYKLAYDCKKIPSSGSNGAITISKVEYYYNEGGVVVPTVQTPEISIDPEQGPYYVGDQVTASITCGTEGAAIQYQINDGTWITEYTAGSDITIPTTTAGIVTIKAKATKNDYNDSGEATKEITISPAATTYDNLAAVNTCNDNTEFTFTAQTVVMGAYGKNMYIVMPDNSAGTLVNASSNWGTDYAFGKVINVGWSGKKETWNTKPRVINPANFELSNQTATVTPIEVSSDADFTLTNYGRYAVMNNVQVDASGNISGITTTYINQFHPEFSGVAGKYDVYGVIGWHNGAGQFMPLRYVEHTGDYTITVNQPAEGGSISASPLSADEGDEIALTASPAPGYELASWTVTDNDGAITVTDNKFTVRTSNVTVTATFSKIWYTITCVNTPTDAANAGNEVWLKAGFDNSNGDRSQVGNTVRFKVHTVNGWQIDNVTAVYGDNNTAITLSEDGTDNLGEFGNEGSWSSEQYGTWYSFTMPAGAVTITGTFRTYVSDLYILGTANGNGWAGNVGVKMDYSSSTEKYTKDVYFAGNTSDGAYGLFNFTESLGYADWSNMGTRYGSNVEDQYDLAANNYTGGLSWWDEHKENAFKVPAGIYTIEVNKAKTQVTVTPKTVNFTFTPAAGEVVTGTEVTVSSNLYELLHAINSNIAETDVTNMVKTETDGDYAASVPITEATTVTGRAKYGYIEPTATAEYTILQENNNTQYQRVSSTDDLVSGKKYIIVYEGDSEAMAEKPSGSNHRLAESVVIDAEHITDIAGKDDVAVLILGGSTDAWTFQVAANNKYLSLAGTSAYLTEVDEVGSENKEQFTISFNNDAANDKSDALIVNNNTNTRSIRHNVASGIGRFGLYNTLNNQGNENTSQPIVQLYRQVENVVTQKVATPVFTPGTGTFTSTQNVEITCATTGATILYKTSEMTEYAEYSTAIEVSQNTTITAYATKNGYTDSDEASATYTFVEPGTDKYVLVTSAAQLVPGNEYIIVAATANPAAAFGAISGNSGTAATGFSINSDISEVTLTNPSDVNVFTLGKEGTGDYCWTFKQSNNKYLYAETNGNRVNEDGGSSYSNLFYISINTGNSNDIHYATIQAGGNHQILYNGSSFRHWQGINLTTTPDVYKNVYLYTKGSVVETPTEITLKNLILTGTPGNPYKISNTDGLLGVYKNGTSVWFKDEEQTVDADYQDPMAANYEYYTVVEQTLGIEKSEKDFAQNNWIEVVFPAEKDFTNAYVSNLTGTYSCDNGNPKLTLTVAVDEENDVVEVPASGLAYELNPYMPVNFAGNQTYTSNGVTKTFFFSKPKAQEYAQILWAVWDGEKFNMPTGDDNYYEFTGSFTVKPDYNAYDLGGLQTDKTYNFTAIIRKSASKAGPYDVYPTDLNPSEIVTAINVINANGQVKSVKYVNVAGMASDVPFQGINIVVTEYTDGSRTTTKMLKK